jgi:hypothetical protein
LEYNLKANKGNIMDTNTVILYFKQLILWMILFNVLMVGLIIYLRFAANAVKDWPSTPGKVTGSRVSYDSSTSKTGAVPFVTYTYEVQGKTYRDGRISPGILTVAGRTSAEKVVALYPRGADVTVYYNPKNASEAYLEKSSQRQLGGMCGIMIMVNLAMPFAVLIVRIVFKH